MLVNKSGEVIGGSGQERLATYTHTHIGLLVGGEVEVRVYLLIVRLGTERVEGRTVGGRAGTRDVAGVRGDGRGTLGPGVHEVRVNGEARIVLRLIKGIHCVLTQGHTVRKGVAEEGRKGRIEIVEGE